MKKLTVVFVALLLLGFTGKARTYTHQTKNTAYGNEVSVAPQNTIITVRKDGSGNYSSIQSAIDASASGDTVMVHSGTYYERITLKSGVQVLGAGANVTIINGGASGTVVTAIGVTGAKLNGFTITNGQGSNGGGIYINNSNPVISNCCISGNSASFGGGILCEVPSGTHITASPILANNIITGNSAVTAGGGLYYNGSYYNVVPITMNHNTITGNSAGVHGGGIYVFFGGINISNTIVNANNGTQIMLNGSGASLSIANSNIQGGLIAIYKGYGTVNWGAGNIDLDPLFVNATSKDFRLSDKSPCIGAGTISGASSKDIEGNPRPNPAGSSPDMGAFENSRATPFTSGIPVIQTTTPASVITATTATSGGDITSEGGAAVTERGVCWSTSANPTTTDSKTTDGTGSGIFTSTIIGLTAGTTYYVRAYATNSVGTAYGNEISFTTLSTHTTINATAGGLSAALTAEQKNTLTKLTLTGTIDARDFKTMRDLMPLLADLDLSAATIQAYTGLDGTYPSMITYEANVIPIGAFRDSNTNTSKISLTTIKFPNTITGIGYAAFSQCTGLTGSLTLPNSVTSIGSYAFMSCSGLTGSLSLPNSLKYISYDAFSGCTGLNSTLSIPNTVISIGNSAFNNCSGLTAIYNYTTAPIDLSHNSATFYNVNKTTCTLYVPAGSKTAYQAAYEWNNFTNIVEMPDLKPSVTTVTVSSITSATSTSGGNVTNEGGAVVTARGVCWSTSANPTIADSKTSDGTGTGAFTSSITGLTPGTTYYARAYATNSAGTAFGNEISFTTPATIITINNTAGGLSVALTVEQKSTLTSLTLTGTIDARDFKTMRDNMPLLAQIDLSGTTIVAYSGMEGTYSYNTNYSADAIPGYAFSIQIPQGNMKWTTIIFPASITAIGDYALQNCKGLNGELTIPSLVTSIGNAAFSGSNCLVNVDSNNSNFFSSNGLLFNKNQTTLIFCPVSKTGSYSIPASVTKIATGAFSECRNLTSVILPPSLANIGGWAFSMCDHLTEINIPSSATSIDEYAFQGCLGFTSISIPAGVNLIGGGAFNGCQRLESIYTYATSPVNLNSSSNVFNTINKTTCKLYVPYGTSALYSAANQWQDFTNIIEMPGFKLSATTANVAATAGSAVTVELTSNTTWSANSDQTWLTVSPASGTGNQTLTFTAEANTASIARTGKITISATGLDPQTITLTQDGKPSVLAIGDSYQGGIIAYILQSGDPGYIEGQTRGIIAAPTDQSTVIRWYNGSYTTTGATATAIGTGNANTNTIVTSQGAGSYAAKLCSDLELNGFNDWYLPSKDELITLYSNKAAIGGFASNFYWSSSESDNTYAWGFYFSYGYVDNTVGKFYGCPVRAVRSFSYVPTVLKVPMVNTAAASTIATTSAISGGEVTSDGGAAVSARGVCWSTSANPTTTDSKTTDGTGSGIFTSTIIGLTAGTTYYVRAFATNSTGTGYGNEISFTTLSTYATINNTAGALSAALTTEQKNSITSLTLTGTIDARDFKTMRDNMPVLADLDISAATIQVYTGPEGTVPSLLTYPANEVPVNAFCSDTGFSKTTLKTIKFPNTITVIGYAAFNLCTGLTGSLTLPNSIETIGSGAFAGCSGLTGSLTLPNSLIHISYYAFSGCTGFNNALSIPKTVTSIGESAFFKCTGLTAIYAYATTPLNLSNNSSVFGYVNKTTCTLYVPAGSKAAYQTAYQWNDFTNIVEMLGVTTATISSIASTTATSGGNITSDGGATVTARGVCWSISTNPTIADGKTTDGAGTGAFTSSITGLTAETSYYVRAYATNSDGTAYGNEISFTTLSTHTTINATAGGLSAALTAEQKNTLTKLTLTGTIDARDVKTIRDSMPLLVEIDLSEVSIVAYAGSEGTISGYGNYPENEFPDAGLNYNTKGQNGILTTVILPSSLTSIGYAAFSDCKALASILLPLSLTSIGSSAFDYCEGLSSISIPSSVAYIGDRAFHYIDYITVHPDNPNYSSIDGVLFNKEKTTLLYCPTSKTGSFVVPSTVTSINKWALLDCSSLTSVILPEGLTIIGHSAFFNCVQLTSIILPSTVSSIQSYAFNSCTNLGSIYTYSITPIDISTSVTVFSSVNKTSCTLNVPAGSKAAYQVANQWQDFTNIVEMPDLKPSVTTVTVSSITSATATSGGNVTNDGGASVTARGVCWSTTTGPTIALTTKTTDAGTTGAFTSSITGLTANTTYFVRAYATNSAGTAYGAEVTFTTLPNYKLTVIVAGTGSGRVSSSPGGINCNTGSCTASYPSGTVVNLTVAEDSRSTFSGWSGGACTGTTRNCSVTMNSDMTVTATFAAIKPTLTTTSVSSITLNAATSGGNVTADVAGAWVTARGVCWSTSANPTIADSKTSDSGTTGVFTSSITGLTAGTTYYARAYATNSAGTAYGNEVSFTTPSNTTINITAGGLSAALTAEQKSTLTTLTLSGTIDARDFKTMRDNMPLLATVDLSGTTVAAYTGTEGTYNTTSIVYPANTIPQRAFYFTTTKTGKTSLKSFVFPASVTTIDLYAFRGSGLSAITIPSPVTLIGYGAFYGSGLASIEIPTSVTKIDKYAFAFCSNLKTITIPASVTSIGSVAFLRSGLTSIAIPNGVTSIGEYAFQSCDFLTTISIPASVNYIGYCAITFDNALTSIQVASDNAFFSSSDGVLFDKTQKKLLSFPGAKSADYLIPSGVTVIDTAAFEGSNVIKNVTIPSSVTTLSPEAFYYCTNLINITIPASVTAIGGYAFFNCYRLKTIQVNAATPVNLAASDSVFKYVDKNVCTLFVPIGSKAAYQAANQWKDFSNIVELSYKTVTVSAGGLYASLTALELSNVSHLKVNGTIDARDFKTMRDNMPLLANLDISGVSVVSYSGFAGPNDGQTTYAANAIPNHAFYVQIPGTGKKSLRTIQLPPTITKIENAAFTASGLTSVNIPNGTTTIEDWAFAACWLDALYLPASLSSIGLCAFTYTIPLPSIQVAGDNPYFTAIDGVLFDKTQKTVVCYPNGKAGSTYQIPAGVTVIGQSAFAGWGLEKVIIPNSVVTLSRYAFYDCESLKTIEIPASVTFIGESAFYDCNRLSSITVQTASPVNLSSSANVFYNVNKTTCTLYVPVGSKAAYQAANQWKDFVNIVEMAGLKPSVTTTTVSSITATSASSGGYIDSDGGAMVTARGVCWSNSANPTITNSKTTNGSGRGSFSSSISSLTSVTTYYVRAYATNSTGTSYGSEISFTTPAMVPSLNTTAVSAITNTTATSGGNVTANGGAAITARGVCWSTTTGPTIAFSTKTTDGAATGAFTSSITGLTAGFTYYVRAYATNSSGTAYGAEVSFTAGGVTTRTASDYYLPLGVGNYTQLHSFGDNGLTYSILRSENIDGVPYFVEQGKEITEGNPTDFHLIRCLWIRKDANGNIVAGAYDNWSDNLATATKLNPPIYLFPNEFLTVGYARTIQFGDISATDSVISVTATAGSYTNCIQIRNIKKTNGVITRVEDHYYAYHVGLVMQNKTFPVQDARTNYFVRYVVNDPAVSKTVNTTAGGLVASMTPLELNTTMNLKITGTIDARDFKTMRDNMPFLARLDLSEVNVVAYVGPDGTSIWSDNYPANAVPEGAFLYASLSPWVGKNSLTSVILPASLTSIGQNAFYSCNGLTNMTIPNLVTTIGDDSFSYSIGLNAITVPSSVTLIGDRAFKNCTGLINVDAENPNYSSLEGVLFNKNQTTLIQCPVSKTGNYYIPTSVSSIGLYAFSYCNGLTSVVIPPWVTSIGGNAFEYCTGLTSLANLWSVTSIGSYAFYKCTGLVSVTISSSVTTIGSSAFGGSSGMITVDVNNPNYSSLDGVLFNKTKTILIQSPTSKTGSYTIPSSVTSIGSYAFTSCSGYTSITIPASVTSIGTYAFADCTGLTSITTTGSIPLKLNSSANVFYNVNKTNCTLNVLYGAKVLYAAANQWQDFTKITEAAAGFTVDRTILTIASDAGSSATAGITANVAWTAVKDQTWLTVSPASGTNNQLISFTATANSSVLTRMATVTFSAVNYAPQTVVVNQYGAVKTVNLIAGSLATSLTAEELNAISRLTITGTIDARDFKTMRDKMPLLAYLDISSATVAAYTGTEGTAGTTSIAYPVNGIPEKAFYISTNTLVKANLISAILPNSVTTIGISAFRSCSSLNSMVLPPSVVSLGNYAFLSCQGLTSITLPPSLTTLGIQAISRCINLASVNIPASVTSIGASAFLGSGASITVNVNNPNYSAQDGLLFDKTKSNLISCPVSRSGSYVIPPSVSTISASAFYNCSNLTAITIPASVNAIGDYAFYFCTRLTTVEIPSSVTSIGSYAFQFCSGLTSITSIAGTPVDLSASTGVFASVNKTSCVLTVPFGKGNLYRAANQWKDFLNIVEMPNASAVVKKATTAPVVDGTIDAVWATANTYNITIPQGTPTLGLPGTTIWKALWTNEGIYVLIQVNDNVFYPAYAVTPPGVDWMYDRLEIYFDVNQVLADGQGPANGNGHRQFAPGFIESQINKGLFTSGDGSTYAFAVANPSYLAEYFIPFNNLRDKDGIVVPKIATMGFEVAIQDRDNEATNWTTAGWSDDGSNGGAWYNMDGCGTITLEGADAGILVTGITVNSAGNATTIETSAGTLQMSASILPVNATNPGVQWSVTNGTGKATIDGNGLLSAYSNGTVTVNAKSMDGSYITATKLITISNQSITPPDAATMVFSIIGSAFYGSNGVTPAYWDYDIDLTFVSTTNNVSSYRINNLELLTNGEFKIRKDHQWTECYGFSEMTITGDPTNFAEGAPDKNIKVIAGKKYEIIFLVNWATNTRTLAFNILTPTVTTAAASAIASTSATSGGEVVNQGGSPVTARGVCWSTSANPTVANSKTTNGAGAGSFTSSLTGLAENTTYYLRAYATNSAGTAYGSEVSFKTTPAGIGTVTDIDGNTYSTVTIGTQVWMASNLKTTKYKDGTDIPLVTINTDWTALSTPGYCWYNNDAATYKSTYGALYNWYTVNTLKLCPTDWHVPSDAEWTILTTFLGGVSVAGGKLMETGTSHWLYPNADATNTSGFTAVPGGDRFNNGTFNFNGNGGYWWSSTESSATYAWYWTMYYNDYGSNVGRNSVINRFGFSVRCLQDSPATVTTTAISNNTQTTATCGGNVIADGGSAVTARGVCWSASANPTISDSKTSNGTGTGIFTSSITGLNPGTTYHVRAYATNSAGTGYGIDQVLTTLVVPAHFTPAWTGNGTDHMNINIYSAKMEGVELEAGDEVGIFDGEICVGAGKLSGPISMQSTLNIAVSKNEGTGNGYTDGNAISFKLYDASKTLEMANVSATYSTDDPSWGTDGKFAAGKTSFAALAGVTKVTQNISMNVGWNIISAYVVPANLELKVLFQALIDGGSLKKVMDEAGKTIENFGAFGGWKNNIGNLNSAKGYKVNVLSESTLSLEGTPVTLPFELALATGWNIISYPSLATQDAKALVQSLIDSGKLKKVMDEAGKTIENFGAFGGWKNNIGNFLPGKGYKVNVLEDCTLTIPANGTKIATIVPEVLASTHFTKAFTGNGTDHFNVHLVDLASSGLVTGDQIGIFDGKYCVGSATIGSDQILSGNISIPASSNEEQASLVNGFTAGHRVSLQLFRENQVYPLAPAKVSGSDAFEKNGSLFAKVTASGLSAGPPTDEKDRIKCYPNPFRDELTIEIRLTEPKKLEVNVYDLSGKLVRNLFKGEAGQSQFLVWDGTNGSGAKMGSGTYILKANEMIEKVALKK